MTLTTSASPTRPRAEAAGPDRATRMAKALAHPLRARLLYSLNERVASPKELAAEHGEPLSNVSYHVKFLADLDCIELVDTAQRRGATEHYYRATQRAELTDEDWAQLPLSARRGFAADTVKLGIRKMAEALPDGGMDDPSTHLSFTRFELDERGRERLAENLRRVIEDAMDDQARTQGDRENAEDPRMHGVFIASFATGR